MPYQSVDTFSGAAHRIVPGADLAIDHARINELAAAAASSP
jgi:hypothetical protein